MGRLGKLLVKFLFYYCFVFSVYTVLSLRITNVKARISPTSPELGLVGTYRASSSSLLTAYKVNETGKLLTDSFKVSAIF